MDHNFFAHTKPGASQAEWQPLADHLEGVAERAAAFASKFGAEAWGRELGRNHDLGKFSQAFQDYLLAAGGDSDAHQLESKRKVDHSTAGAQWAVEQYGVLGHLLAFALAGHHGGLPDMLAEDSCLEKRLKKVIEPWREVAKEALQKTKLKPPASLDHRHPDFGFRAAFFTRMLFSCLVDADFLDTEAFMSAERAGARPTWPKSILAEMSEALDCRFKGFGLPKSDVDRQRVQVRQACVNAAPQTPGLFSLTVPTGGGKTLSSLAFALAHAQAHGLDRVIYVIPFTSIIEQNAQVFREVMQPLVDGGLVDPVLEHHSNLDVGEETVQSRLATENWEAPLVVTTSVQFYESLFANKTSRCRKLHNMSRAVIILDEVQSLPVDFLKPSLQAIKQLTDHYGSTVVLCTATQPAVNKRDGFDIGIAGVREIVSDPRALYQALKRVELTTLGPVSDLELVPRLLAQEQVLCIVNTRGQARDLFSALGDDEGHFHLSAQMVPVHRAEILDQINQRLAKRQTCRVISTQLVEAGVDIDFPVVYRALSGLDSIAQAAGRCNRHGRLAQGQTFVFESEHQAAEGFIKDRINPTREILTLHEDLLSLDATEHFFQQYYWGQSDRWDRKDICGDFKKGDTKTPFLFSFKTAAQKFKLIEDSGQPVIVPYGEKGARLCEKLRTSYGSVDPILLRKLQRFTVQIRQREWTQNSASIELVHDRYPVLISPELHYDLQLGLNFAANN